MAILLKKCNILYQTILIYCLVACLLLKRHATVYCVDVHCNYVNMHSENALYKNNIPGKKKIIVTGNNNNMCVCAFI